MSDLLYRLSSMPPSQNLSRDAITEILNLQKQKEELEDRLEHEVEIIECAAQDEINRLTKELETTKKQLNEAKYLVQDHTTWKEWLKQYEEITANIIEANYIKD